MDARIKRGHDALRGRSARTRFAPQISHYRPTTSMCWPKLAPTTRAGEIAWGNRGCISWPLSGPSEPPCRTAAIDLSCTTCAARGRSGSSVTADSLLESFRRSAWPVPFRHGRRQPFVRREALRRDPYRVSRSSPSCPAKAGHPVITEYLVVTGSPAFAGDDDKEATDRTKNHHALDAYAAAAARLRTLSIREARSK
jgi:hypothetical protein